MATSIKPNVEIIAMIYKSVDYLEFILNQFKSESFKVPGWDVGVRLVANDATNEILEALATSNTPYTIYNDPKPEDFYLNRVYRCWNYGGRTSTYDNICFVNSDMAFGEDWLVNLLKHHDGHNIPCSRLVESGRIPVAIARHGIAKNFGTSPREFDGAAFQSFVTSVREDRVVNWGLLMPCIFEKARFMEAGLYPEGNIFLTESGFEIGRPNDILVHSPGDVYFFDEVLVKKFNMKHITVFDSIVYHIQEGEMDA